MTQPDTTTTEPTPRVKRHVLIHLDELGGRSEFFIGDHDIASAVRGLRLSLGKPDYVPRIELDLATADVDIDGDWTVRIEPKTHAALVALGWIPPLDAVDDPEQLREMASQLLTWANAAEARR